MGYSRVYFVFLERSVGLRFGIKERNKIITKAYRDDANHILLHGISQRSLDGFKLTSYLAYHTARHIVETKSHGATQDPAKEACRAGIERLDGLLRLESSQEIILSEKEKGYLVSMFYAEITGHCDVGIGANGLGTLFGFLNRVRPEPDRLKKI